MAVAFIIVIVDGKNDDIEWKMIYARSRSTGDIGERAKDSLGIIEQSAARDAG